ncbi:hypothetical protein ACFTWF_22180 [Rhodococcus sp. NPDC056960]|uniref:hypothetical protein n=1 Tax=Rhodococcus sp. NPDC056960 TaxID=3345982 RepID=UPI00364207EA
MSTHQRTNHTVDSNDATDSPTPPASLWYRILRTIFTTAMTVTVLGGILAVAGQALGLVVSSGPVVLFFANYPSKAAFIAASVVCISSLLLSYCKASKSAPPVDDEG